MKRLYLIAAGATLGAVTGAACEHLALWTLIGAAIGVAWPVITPARP